MTETNEIKNLLRARKLKVTALRLALLSCISENQTAISYSKIIKQLKHFDRVTLYRNLITLKNQGIIHQALTEGQETFYAMCSLSCNSEKHLHQHIHFKCSLCDEVSCVPSTQAQGLSLPGFVVESFRIEAKGICTNCCIRTAL
jgi:Fur family ferric uptake transcriptional regulator